MAKNESGKHGAVGSDMYETDDTSKQDLDLNDRVDMDRMGKKQELKRNFRLFSIFSFMCVAMSSWVFVIRYVYHS